jgi:hypothetical protein
MGGKGIKDAEACDYGVFPRAGPSCRPETWRLKGAPATSLLLSCMLIGWE